MQNARSAKMKSFIAKQQRMSLTKAYCSSDATGPKDWDLKQQKTKGGKHTNDDKVDYTIGFHGGVALMVMLCTGRLSISITSAATQRNGSRRASRR